MEKTPINYCKIIDSYSDDENNNDDEKYTAEIINDKKTPKYSCELCDYECSKTIDWNRHISTSKHINRTQNSYVANKRFECNNCNFLCKKESEWIRHIETKKQKVKISLNEDALTKTNHICNI